LKGAAPANLPIQQRTKSTASSTWTPRRRSASRRRRWSWRGRVSRTRRQGHNRGPPSLRFTW